MIVFVTSSHNQYVQLDKLYSSLNLEFGVDFQLIITESGDSTILNELFCNKSNVIVLTTDSDSFWSKSIAISLEYYFSHFNGEDLVLLNCDVLLNNWSALKSCSGLTTYYSVDNNIVERSGYEVSNWYTAKHYYPYFGVSFDTVQESMVEIIPTRLAFIEGRLARNLINELPNYSVLPHYAGDFEYTFRISRLLQTKWRISKATFIVEDKGTTGKKHVSGKFFNRVSLLFDIRSVYNIKNRFYLSFLVSKEKSVVKRFCYVTSSVIKPLVQVFAL